MVGDLEFEASEVKESEVGGFDADGRPEANGEGLVPLTESSEVVDCGLL